VLKSVMMSSSDELTEAFPEVPAGVTPYGSRVLVQVRTAKKKTAGGIILTDEGVDTEKWNTQVAKVLSLGPVAFKNRNTLESWKEGDWCKPGDFVRVPKYAGDRWLVPTTDDKNGPAAMFVIFNDLDIIGRIDGDPLAVKAFVI